MRLHSPQDIVQYPHRTEHVGTLVEHDTLGTVPHRRVKRP